MLFHRVQGIGARCLTATAWAIITTGVCGGCGRADHGPERVVVSGTVTYNGQPVAQGRIRFVPDEQSPVPPAGAPISNGQFRADTRGGVPVGTFRVQIEAVRELEAPSEPGTADLPQFAMGPGVQQYIPAKYNARTTLELTIPPGSRAITKTFDLTD